MSERRVPPHSIEAERIVLGSMMLSGEAAETAEEVLKPGAFYRPAHEWIFDAIVAMRAAGEPTDPVALGERLLDSGLLSKVGGFDYLHTCYASVPVAVSVGHYAEIVSRKAVLRRLAQIADRLSYAVYDEEQAADPDALMDDLREKLADIEEAAAQEGESRRWEDVLPEVFAAVERAALNDGPPGIPTGLADLDRLIGGWRNGQLIVVAARTGVGKSVATTGFATHAAFRADVTAAVFSMEMKSTELGTRIASAESRIPLHALKTGNLDVEDWKKLSERTGETSRAPLFIEDSANMTLADIRSRARKLHRKHGLQLLVVDYLQLIETARAENRQNAVAAVSRGLKLLAMELNIPVIAVSQLNRGPENRPNKLPTKSDLRESGAIENDADVIILLHREDYYDPESPRAGEADFIVDKQRDGATDTITVAAQLHLSRFVDMAIA